MLILFFTACLPFPGFCFGGDCDKDASNVAEDSGHVTETTPSSTGDTGSGDSDADSDADSDMDTDADSDADADADSDADMDTDADSDADSDTGVVSSTGDTGSECLDPEALALEDGQRVTLCGPNLLNAEMAFEVPGSEPNPGIGFWDVNSQSGQVAADLGPSNISWPSYGGDQFWSLSVLVGTVGGTSTDECLGVLMTIDPYLEYGVAFTAKSTTSVDNTIYLVVDGVQLGTTLVPQNVNDMRSGIGSFANPLGEVYLELCSGTLQGGVSITHLAVREMTQTP